MTSTEAAGTAASLIPLAARLPRPIGYVLAGGASYGAVQAGQLRALAKTDLRPDFVVGTSVGSLNGAVVAEDPDSAADRLSALWASVTREEVFGSTAAAAMSVIANRPAAMSNSGLEELIGRAMTSRKFSDLKIPLTAVATNFDTGDAVGMSDGDLTSALLASAAIPGVFPSVLRGGLNLVDGGLVANVPMSFAHDQGAGTIVVLDCGFTVVAPETADTMFKILMRAVAIMAAQQVRHDLEECADRTVVYLPGPWPMKGRPDEFIHSEEYAEAAYELSLQFLKGFEPDGQGRYGYAPVDSLADPVHPAK